MAFNQGWAAHLPQPCPQVGACETFIHVDQESLNNSWLTHWHPLTHCLTFCKLMQRVELQSFLIKGGESVKVISRIRVGVEHVMERSCGSHPCLTQELTQFSLQLEKNLTRVGRKNKRFWGLASDWSNTAHHFKKKMSGLAITKGLLYVWQKRPFGSLWSRKSPTSQSWICFGNLVSTNRGTLNKKCDNV